MKKSFAFLSVFLLLAGSLFSQEEIVTLKRNALVIGNQNYEEYPLTATIADSQLIAAALEEKGFSVFLYNDLTQDAAKAVVNEYIDLVNSDTKSVSFIYYGGHGYTDGDENFLVPVNNGDIHSEEELKEKSLVLTDIASRIYTSAQIYVVDGGYDNPFKNLDTRGLGIKGSLSAAKSKRESQVSYLFSAQPEAGVLYVNETNSPFAKALSNQIRTNDGYVGDVFNEVKTIVEEATGGEQVPYVSATGLTFTFGGEQLSRLQNQQLDLELEKAQNESAMTEEAVQAYEEEQKRLYEEKIASAASAKERLDATLALQILLRKQEDERRAREEAEAALNRRQEENEEIERVKANFEALAEQQKKTITKKTGADEKITSIEQVKETVWNLRSDVETKTKLYNSDKDAETEAKTDEIWNAPYKMTETDSQGILTKAARASREKKVNAVIAAAEKDKARHEKELQASIKATDDKAMAQLKKLYNNLESGTYETTSFTDDLTVRIGNYDGATGTWPLTVTSALFGYTTLFTQEIPLSYTDVTGKKIKPINKMSDKQFEQYNNTVELYDSLFRSSTDVFYVRLVYKIEKWSWASQYRFVPTKCEIVRLDKKSKVIHQVNPLDMKKVTFTVYPTIEVRSAADIQKEQKKNGAKLEAEEKEYLKRNAALLKAQKKTEEEMFISTGTTATAMASVSKPAESNQKGRGILMVTAEKNVADFANSLFMPDLVGAELTFPTAKFAFFGLNFQTTYPLDTDKFYFQAGLETGFNFKIGKHVRPYVKAAANLDRNLNAVGKVGGGLDLIFAKVLTANIGYNYNSVFDCTGFFNKDIPAADCLSNYHSISAGVGFAW